MTIYNPTIPQPPDIPQESQSPLLSNFQILNSTFSVNHVPFANIVSNLISNGSVTNVISTNHLLSTGATVIFETVQGLLNGVPTSWTINGSPLVVTVIDSDTFSVVYDSSAQPPYIANSGSYYVTSTFPYGYHKQISLAAPIQTPTIAQQANSAVYSKYDSNGLIVDLFFKNGTTAALEKLLSNVVLTPRVNSGQGFTTPWGLIINFGNVYIGETVPQHTVTFPVSFTTNPQCILFTVTRKTSNSPRILSTTNTSFLLSNDVLKENIWYFAMGV